MTKPIYIQNKYNIWYHNIIATAQSQDRVKGNGTYYENHHIQPKSFGGTNQKSNLILLTAREHFICHALLVKFTTGQYKHKTIYAFNMMYISSLNQIRYINSRLYESNKTKLAEMQTGKKLSNKTKDKMSKARLGNNHHYYNKPRSNETKLKISISMKGKNNHQYRGDYITPWGLFTTLKEASDTINNLVNSRTIGVWCKNPDKIITNHSIGQSLYLQQLPESPLGKTFREIGFWFIFK